MKVITNILNSIEFFSQGRHYIGASSIGHPCDRNIWYKSNGCVGPMDSKLFMTYEIGKTLEKSVIDTLALCKEIKIDSSKESNAHKDSESSLQGTSDAIIELDGIKYILEIKTANNASFSTFVEDGLISWNRTYYCQLQSYMGISGIHNGILLALNKDTSAFHDESIDFSDGFFKDLRRKADYIESFNEPPPKIHQYPTFYLCRRCEFKDMCHE